MKLSKLKSSFPSGDLIQMMRDYGRIPMSFSHGDFDYDYLRSLATNEDGSRRFNAISFAAHFDRFMFGRRGIKRPKSESDLHSYRKAFCDMFHRLKAETIVDRFYLAHNMTVTPGNVDEIPDVIRSCRFQGWSLMSHQPAAFVGDSHRWAQNFRGIDADEVWKKIEVRGETIILVAQAQSFRVLHFSQEGVGRSLPFSVMQMGDSRCNRSVWGFWVGDVYHPFLEESVEDLKMRDLYLR